MHCRFPFPGGTPSVCASCLYFYHCILLHFGELGSMITFGAQIRMEYKLLLCVFVVGDQKVPQIFSLIRFRVLYSFLNESRFQTRLIQFKSQLTAVKYICFTHTDYTVACQTSCLSIRRYYLCAVKFLQVKFSLLVRFSVIILGTLPQRFK